jgi:hypothetical protein
MARRAGLLIVLARQIKALGEPAFLDWRWEMGQIKAPVRFDASPPGQDNFRLGDAAALSAFRSIAQQPYSNPERIP